MSDADRRLMQAVEAGVEVYRRGIASHLPSIARHAQPDEQMLFAEVEKR